MSRCESPLHIVSAQLSEWGMTFAQRSVDEKRNEIPAVQELLNELELKGCMVVADALNCQKETAERILEKKGDYLLCAKDNQATLKKEIEEYVQDQELRKRWRRCGRWRTTGANRKANRICNRRDRLDVSAGRVEAACVHWGNPYGIGKKESENGRMALLYLQQKAKRRGVVASCANGMVGGNNALASGCSLCRRFL